MVPSGTDGVGAGIAMIEGDGTTGVAAGSDDDKGVTVTA
jgi:hypothetical protein